MKTEFKILFYSMINNLIISILKITGGITLNLHSLIADGFQTLSDFITDIVCMIGAKLSKKRPTKYHPFGFGKVEYLTNLFVGIILLILGTIIIINSFNIKTVIPPLKIFYILLIVSILKIIAIFILHHTGKKLNSHILITSLEESSIDLYATFGIMIITILLQFSNKYPLLKYSDLIGTILIGLLIIKTGLKIVIDNSLSLIGEVDINKDIIKKLNIILTKYNILDNDIDLIKYGSYYKLQLIIELDSKLTLKQVTKIVNKIKKDIIKEKKLKIKYVTIYVTNNL